MDSRKFNFRTLLPGDTAETYDIRFSCTENIIHPHQIKYLLREQLLEDINQGGGWICFDGDIAVGFCLPLFAPEPMLACLYVRPEYQGHGIGKKLLELATAWLINNQAKTVILETDPGSRADEFYKRNGWQRGEMAEFGLQVIYRLTPNAPDCR